MIPEELAARKTSITRFSNHSQFTLVSSHHLRYVCPISV